MSGACIAFVVAHELPGRLRLRARGPASAAAGLAATLLGLPGVTDVKASRRTGSVLVSFTPSARVRRRVLAAAHAPAEITAARLPSPSGAVLPLRPEPPAVVSDTAPANEAAMEGGGLWGLARVLFLRPFMPAPLRAALAVFRAWPFLRKGLAALRRGRLGVDVLDAAAIAVSLLRRDFRSAATVTLLLSLGEFLESWTRKKSRDDLAQALRLDVGQVWVRRDGVDVSMDGASLAPGDMVVVRTGSAMPVDGVVEEGEAMVNQASLTGEPLAVRRVPGDSVYAGTVVEEGTVVVRTVRAGGETRLSSLLSAIEDSERLKAAVQGRMERLADAAVPLTLGLAALTFLLTRNAAKATAVLLVDYSCSIKLATPLAVLSAMRQSASRGALIKGGRFLETMAQADTVLFDKTGTLTEARPSVRRVLAAPGREPREILRIAACLEEHFPHPVARAVVREAEAQGLEHREEHAEVEYVAAHGIASLLHGRRVLLGSRHFVHEDEGVPEALAKTLLKGGKAKGCSVLHMAVGGELAGLILLDDPLRPEASDIVRGLRARGVRHVAMLTGDGPEAAAVAARAAGIDEIHSRLLPEDKRALVRRFKEEGRVVAVVGDGVNDSWALSEADVGISPHQGADVAREVCDVLLTSGDLRPLLLARDVSRLSLRRINSNFRLVMGVNSALLLLGLAGVLRPALAALLHNATTILAALNALRPLALPAAGDDGGET